MEATMMRHFIIYKFILKNKKKLTLLPNHPAFSTQSNSNNDIRNRSVCMVRA